MITFTWVLVKFHFDTKQAHGEIFDPCSPLRSSIIVKEPTSMGPSSRNVQMNWAWGRAFWFLSARSWQIPSMNKKLTNPCFGALLARLWALKGTALRSANFLAVMSELVTVQWILPQSMIAKLGRVLWSHGPLKRGAFFPLNSHLKNKENHHINGAHFNGIRMEEKKEKNMWLSC